MKRIFFLVVAIGLSLSLKAQVKVGDIMCVQDGDTTFVHPGNYTGGAIGVVFYVDESGEHGWVLHPQTQASGIYWSYYCELPLGLTGWNSIREAIYDLDGYDNTYFLRLASQNDHNIYPGAWVVDFEYGWYWPALGQLNILYGSLPIVNNSLELIGGESLDGRWVCWSSSVYGFDNDCALYISDSGQMGAIIKSRTELTHPIIIRSIRNF